MDRSSEFDLIAACAFGLEAVVRRELQALGFDAKIGEAGRVHFRGGWEAIGLANLWLRCADRVLIRVAEFPAADFDALFDTVLAIRWGERLPADAAFPVTGRSIKSTLTSVPACQRAVKRAIVDAMRRDHHTDELPETGPLYKIDVALLKDVATITIDTTGRSLHRRGYRTDVSTAPLKETLAAALVSLSYFKRDRPLIDPFCGSGTIVIEAAMIGRNMAPGQSRDFAFEQWPQSPAERLLELRTEALAGVLEPLPQRLIGGDIDGRVLRAARDNAERAGVTADTHFEIADVRELRSKRRFGCLITNPPYGMRIGRDWEVEALYASLPHVLRHLPTWSFYFLTAFEGFENVIGRQADRRRKLYNGRIECTYYQFQGPKPVTGTGEPESDEPESAEPETSEPETSDPETEPDTTPESIKIGPTSQVEIDDPVTTDDPATTQVPATTEVPDTEPERVVSVWDRAKRNLAEKPPSTREDSSLETSSLEPAEIQPAESQPPVSKPSISKPSISKPYVHAVGEAAFGSLPEKAYHQAELFAARLTNRAKHLRRWPTKRGITCFRLYERDVPEIPLVVDRYEGYLHLTEFERPHDRDIAQHANWLDLMAETAGKTLQVPAENVFMKRRSRQRGKTQHQKLADTGQTIPVREGGLTFLVNLADYVDTGLFLDHRITRQRVRDEAAGKHFLNLFAYTGSFTTYAAAGGATSTTSVDLSQTYLDWAQENLRVNGLDGKQHQFAAMDIGRFIAKHPPGEVYDLVVCDPPTFSNSKSTQQDWNVQTDAVPLLIDVLKLVRPGGVIYFSNNFRRFKFDSEALAASQIHEISKQTVPEDFRNRRIHRCWRIVK